MLYSFVIGRFTHDLVKEPAAVRPVRERNILDVFVTVPHRLLCDTDSIGTRAYSIGLIVR